jgi:small acid-soluble spore protein I (minor)
MDLNLRQAIIQRVQDKNNEELLEVINSSVESDERALPGLGVLFEIIWKNCEQDTQNQLIQTLKTHI